MEIIKVNLLKIEPAEYNPRKDLQPGEPEYEKLKRSIEEFGFLEPLVVNKRTGHIISGHQRLKILKAQGIAEAEAVIVDFSIEKEKAANLALNKIRGEWNNQKLALLLDELSRMPDFDVSLTGFDLPEISQLFDSFEEVRNGDDFDFAGTVDSIIEPVTKRGDLINLGPHRLLCGDSANSNDIKLLMDGHKAQMYYTDPPFNCRYKNSRPTKRSRLKKPPKWEKIYKDDLPQEEYERWLEQVFTNVNEYLLPNSPIYVWNGHRQFGCMYLMLLKLGYQIGSVIVWAKEHFAISYADYNQQVEFCLYGWKKGQGGHFWYGPHNETTLWEVKRDAAKLLIHPTQKPVELAQRAIRNSSKRGDVIIETFLGSGSTLIASESLNRCCFGVEINERYCDAIVRRYISYVGIDKISEEVRKKYLQEVTNGK